ncbi:MAG: protein disulfide bond isomerase, DsbC/DsbG-like, one heme-binding site [Deltaproteobacteria bacterium]|jgi:thiol:disulfide interchange protein DsbC|nr:protein disulfide bond isomerase, DsbC/DsbG-like, one heme-binding site [Deltaproteobacteria bacterium]
MRKSLLLALIVSAFLFFACGGPAQAFKEGAENCAKCHTLSEKELGPILAQIRAPDAKVLEIQPSPIKGLWEVSFERRGQRFVVYVDYSKKFVTPGPIIEYASGKDKTREKVATLNEAKRVNVAQIPLKEALLVGKEDATRKVIVFLDPD